MYPSRDKPRRNITWVGRVLKLRSKGGHWGKFLQELGESWGGVSVHDAVAGWLVRLWFRKGVEVSSLGMSEECLNPEVPCMVLPMSPKGV
jgi:hypothetical protein